MTKTQKKTAATLLRVELAAVLGTGNPKAITTLGDVLTRELSAFGSFQELLDASRHGYTPTLREAVDPRAAVLADLYDYSQAYRGRSCRAFRG